MRRHPIMLLLLSGLVLLVLPAELFAMPTFSRRYHTSCATCHQAFPRLNAVGESFRLNGYRFVDDDLYQKVPPVELGDKAYKRLWPRALWPSGVPSTSPLSIISRMMAEGDLDRTRKSAVTLLLPEEVEFVWVANLGDDISLYGDVIFLQKDFGGADVESWATLKSWIQFQGLVGENWMNLRVGTVGTQSMGLFTARDANFYSTHFYLYTTWVMPKIHADTAGLTEFIGNNFSIGPQAGIEVNGFGTRWSYAGGIVGGDLAAPAGAAPDSDISFVGSGGGRGTDMYLQLAYKFGGAPFDRRGEAASEVLTTSAEFWRDDSTTVSLFGYRGGATVGVVDLDGRVREDEDPFWRLGASVQHQFRDLTLGAVWTAGHNARPYAPLSLASVTSRAWHVEAMYFAYPWLLPYARFESLDMDLPDGIPGLEANQDISRLLLGAKAMIRPNVGLIAESPLYTRGAQWDEGRDRTLFVMLSFGF